MEQIFLDFTKEDGDNEEARDAEPLCDTPTSLNRLVVPHISGLGGGIKAGWWCLLSPSSTQPRVPHKGTSGSTATRTTGSRSSRASCGRPFRANVRDTRPQLATQATDRTRSLCCCCCTLHVLSLHVRAVTSQLGPLHFCGGQTSLPCRGVLLLRRQETFSRFVELRYPGRFHHVIS